MCDYKYPHPKRDINKIAIASSNEKPWPHSPHPNRSFAAARWQAYLINNDHTTTYRYSTHLLILFKTDWMYYMFEGHIDATKITTIELNFRTRWFWELHYKSEHSKNFSSAAPENPGHSLNDWPGFRFDSPKFPFLLIFDSLLRLASHWLRWKTVIPRLKPRK